MKITNNWGRKLDVSANVATIALTLLLAVAFLRGAPPFRQARSLLAPKRVEAGMSLRTSPLKINWAASDRTLVFGLQTTCHFCTESAPFFRKLVKSVPKDMKTVAVLPQTTDEAKQYLDALGVRINDVRQASLSDIGITGTPTLLLVDNLGVVKSAWVGKLSPVAQAAVLSAVQGGSTPQSGSSSVRRVRLELYRPDDPVRIVRVMDGDQDVTPGTRPFKVWQGKPFQAGDDWVKNLTVVIKNLSNKEIVAANIMIDTPTTGETETFEIVGSTISLGRRPPMYVRGASSGKEYLLKPGPAAPLHISPGQELTVPLAPYYADIKQAVEAARPMWSVTVCWIRLRDFFFSDGTWWSADSFKKPDPSSPGKYIGMTANEFWGRSPIGKN
ncbi:MAG TPA: hypothetical protein VGR93_06110 [Candidatus Acidoferrales bacterium]|nr:hypothetical protein [Candidatus Acidoferrales bacterium]